MLKIARINTITAALAAVAVGVEALKPSNYGGDHVPKRSQATQAMMADIGGFRAKLDRGGSGVTVVDPTESILSGRSEATQRMFGYTSPVGRYTSPPRPSTKDTESLKQKVSPTNLPLKTGNSPYGGSSSPHDSMRSLSPAASALGSPDQLVSALHKGKGSNSPTTTTSEKSFLRRSSHNRKHDETDSPPPSPLPAAAPAVPRSNKTPQQQHEYQSYPVVHRGGKDGLYQVPIPEGLDANDAQNILAAFGGQPNKAITAY